MMKYLVCCVLLFTLPAWAQKLEVQGVPVAISYIDNQNMVDRGVIAIVIEDANGEKRVVTGNCTSRRAAAEMLAMVRAEINDGDQEMVIIHCTRKQAQPENDREYKPGAQFEMITSLQVESHKWNRRVWGY